MSEEGWVSEKQIPTPVRTALNEGTSYWMARPEAELYRSCEMVWDGDYLDIRWLQRGLIHRTPEAAAFHGRLLASLTEEP